MRCQLRWCIKKLRDNSFRLESCGDCFSGTSRKYFSRPNRKVYKYYRCIFESLWNHSKTEVQKIFTNATQRIIILSRHYTCSFFCICCHEIDEIWLSTYPIFSLLSRFISLARITCSQYEKMTGVTNFFPN